MPAFVQRLDILTPVALLVPGLLTVLACGTAVALHRRRRGPWSRPGVAGSSVVAAALAVVTALAAVNLHFEFLPQLGDAFGYRQWPVAPLTQVTPAVGTGAVAVQHPAGAVVALPIAGTRSGFGVRTALVYLPPQYFLDPTERFPVVYLLHGMPGAPVDWFRAGDAARAGAQLAAAGRPAILVAPRLSRSWLSDSECVDGVGGDVETYLAGDVVAAVDRAFRTDPVPAARLLLGLSAGGYCALNAGLQHQATFGAIADLSGLDRPTHVHGARGLFGAAADATALVAADSPLDYLPTLRVDAGERVYLGCGDEDDGPLHDERLVDAALTARGVPVTFVVSPGDHSYAYWRAALPAALAWWAGRGGASSARR